MKVIVTGSLSFDGIMSMPGRFKDYLQADKLHLINVSFLMETFRKEQGGTAGNQAYSLALLGLKPVILACAGRDFKQYKSRLEKSGVDVRQIGININKVTAIGFCMTDRDDNQIWGFYSGAMAGDKKLSLIGMVSGKDIVLITPTEPLAMEKFVIECCRNGYRFLFDPAFQIPRLKSTVLQKAVDLAEIVVGNDYEIALLEKRVKLNRKRIVITTFGARGSLIEIGENRFRIPIAKPNKIVDPTGAGDAYRAGFLAGYLKKLPVEVCGRMGALAAVYTVEKYGTQTHKFTLTEFRKRYKSNFKQELRFFQS